MAISYVSDVSDVLISPADTAYQTTQSALASGPSSNQALHCLLAAFQYLALFSGGSAKSSIGEVKHLQGSHQYDIRTDSILKFEDHRPRHVGDPAA